MFAKLPICAECYIYSKKHGISHIIYKELPYYGGGLAIPYSNNHSNAYCSSRNRVLFDQTQESAQDD